MVDGNGKKNPGRPGWWEGMKTARPGSLDSLMGKMRGEDRIRGLAFNEARDIIV